MPTEVELNGFIDTFRTLAGVCFTLGITVAIGYIGWQVAKSYFFSGAGDRQPPVIKLSEEESFEDHRDQLYDEFHSSGTRRTYQRDDIPF